MIQKLKYKNMPRAYHKQINELKEFTTDLEEVYKIDTNILFIVYIKNNTVVAYLAYKELDETYDIYNIVTHKECQRNGIAQQLINEIKDKSIILEVKENNHVAIEFYKKNNFKEQFIKKKYYKDGQDAIVMIKEV